MRSLIAAAAVACAGCQNIECGANTIERDGQCVAEPDPPGTECGPGTTYDPGSGRCIAVLSCGENTTMVVNDAGQPVCVGTGGTLNCEDPIVCPPPQGDAMTVCGRIFDLENSVALDDGNSGNGEPFRDVVLEVYDGLALATQQTPPVVKTASPDSCGRYAITDVPIASLPSQFIAIVADDAVATTDDLVPTAIADNAAVGALLTDRRAWRFRRATDAAWSTAASLSGDSFATQGVYVQIFLSGSAVAPFTTGGPRTGVKVAVGDSRNVVPDQDYYFTDTDPLVRLGASSTQDATGANGTGLLLGATLGNYSGVGQEDPPGACWAKTLAATLADSAFVQERLATTGSCP